MPATRGVPTTRVNAGSIVSVIVEIPADSMARAANPTDRQQNGQTGASNATSTFSARILAIIAGILDWRNSSGRSR